MVEFHVFVELILEICVLRVVVHFSASWCIPYVAMNPFFEDIASAYPNALLLTVNVDDVKCVQSLIMVTRDRILATNFEEEMNQILRILPKREKEDLEAALKSRTHSSAMNVDQSMSFPGKDELESTLQKMEKDLNETRRQRDKASQELARLKQHLLQKWLVLMSVFLASKNLKNQKRWIRIVKSSRSYGSMSNIKKEPYLIWRKH